MKQVLEARMGQHLTLTPQLQQAIRLLQLSAQDLSQEIQKGLENNPLLELSEESEAAQAPPAKQEGSQENLQQPETTTPMDDPFRFEQGESQNWSNVRNKQYKEDFDNHIAELKDDHAQSFQAHLIWQLGLMPFSDEDRLIAEAIIDAIDDDGYLSCELDDVIELVHPSYPDVQMDEVEAVLSRIQHFDPIGTGCRSLQEYLLLQLDLMAEETEFLALAKTLVGNALEAIASHDIKTLRRVAGCSEKQLFSAWGLIKSLSPRPRCEIAENEPNYVIPDVVVSKINGKWVIELNNNVTPSIQINKYYANILNTQKSQESFSQLKLQLQEARWLVKSLASRNETLLKVSTCIMKKQKDFLDHGDVAMKPLILQNIAEETNLHESTVSRITNQKFIQTPLGVFELKYFFSSHLSRDNGQECSSIAIRALIKKIIANEPEVKPFSDNKIAQILSAQQGIQIARRTITKYREAMNIPASNLRKRAKQFVKIKETGG